MKSKSSLFTPLQVIGFIIFIVVVTAVVYRVTTTSFDDRSRAATLRRDQSIFTDVPKNSYGFGAIERIYRLGLTAGCNQNPLQFCPNRPVTRGETIVFIARALYGPATGYPAGSTPVFTDVPSDHPFRPFIEKAYREKITSGCSQDPLAFCPDQILSRREMAVFFVRALHGVAYTPSPSTGTVFRDVSQQVGFSPYIEQFYRDGMATILWPGGNETNFGCNGAKLSFCPYASATRSDVAIVIERLLDRPAVFTDVPVNYWAFSSIQRIAREGITSGCLQSPKKYCPDNPVTRAEAAVLMLRGKNGSSYAPPSSPEGPFFTDVPATHPFYGYVQQLYRDRITSGCSQNPLKFCPDQPMTRGEAAVMMLRIQNGSSFQPPAATGGVFADVKNNTTFAGWIEEFYRSGMTVGCSATPLMYCPTANATRAEFAVFLDRLFKFD